MTGKTHIAVGITTAIAMGTTSPIGLGVAAVGALAPDIDHPNSKISHRVTPGKLPRSTLGRYLAGFILLAAGGLLWKPLAIPGLILVILAGIPHRGFIHSPALALAIGMVAASIMGIDRILVISFLIGYISHLIADMAGAGIPLLWPISNNRYGFHIVHTGSMLEWVVFLDCTIFIGFSLFSTWHI